MADVYSFTTTQEDDYVDRVVVEASKGKNVFLLREHNTATKNEHVFVLIREEYLNKLANKYPNEQFCGETLGDLLLMGLQNEWRLVPGFRVMLAFDQSSFEADKLLTAAKNDTKRLQNLDSGRVIRVTVEGL